MTSRIKRIKKELYDDSWMYILILTTLVILLESLKSYEFIISNIRLSYSIFLLPLVFLIVNYIAKKYDYKKAIAAISISAVTSVCFVAVMSFALGRSFILSSQAGEFFGYVGSQFVNLTIYYFLLNNTKQPLFLTFMNYMFSLIVYYMLYTLIYLQMIILEDFWIGYLLTVLIQFLICIPISIIDKKIKRGREYIGLN